MADLVTQGHEVVIALPKSCPKGLGTRAMNSAMALVWVELGIRLHLSFVIPKSWNKILHTPVPRIS